MATLYHQEWMKDELRERSGDMKQIAGCTRYRLQDGPERDVEIIDVRTGSGFRFQVCPSRGMDIPFAEHNGRPLCWQSSTGVIHPAYYEKEKLGWLRGFAGGLLTTCGLSSFGVPNEEEGESYGLHDRISYIPANEVNVSQQWTDKSTFEISISGHLRQTRVFGPNLVLHRRISTAAGSNFLTVDDTLTNEGFVPEPAVILYHCNFGFPVVSEHSRIDAPSKKQTPVDDFAAQSVDSWNRMEEPQAGLPERCYAHQMQAHENGMVRASIVNEKLDFGAYVEYRAKELPYFMQWKTMACGTYVTGLEPSNAPLKSRDVLRELGELPCLEPGESWNFQVRLGVLESSLH
ncbi:MAG: aldose 1-epimerase family protein [Abditibacteriaceae bacterium]